MLTTPSEAVRQVHLTSEMDDKEVDKLAGTMLGEDAYDLLLDEDCDVYKPNGEVLLKLRKNILPQRVIPGAYKALKDAAQKTSNRGIAAGVVTDEELEKLNANGKGRRFIRKGARLYVVKADGKLSQTSYAKEVGSGIVGYFDRNPRFPYCRLTAFSLNQPDKFKAALPFVRAVDDVFHQAMPERYDAQMEQVMLTDPDFYISGTSFTTITVNSNFRTAVHKDKGDLKQGFGVLSAICAGEFEGAYFCIPKYRVAANMRTADVLLADVHEWHGNSPLYGKEGRYERLSCVFYYRQGMVACGTEAEELDRAKLLRG